MSLESEIRSYLAVQLPTKTIKMDQLGPTSEDQIAVTMNGGGVTIRSGTIEADVQVLVRATTVAQAKTDAKAVYDALHNKSNILATITARLVKAKHAPYFAYTDDNDRIVYYLDFTVFANNY